ncbi:alcohol oxidase [Hymenopellis radicata]|nr:alcohol oxidase [Hymenopellis radicata]
MSFTVVEDVKSQAFDYVIVGGGTAGLLIAARLTQDSSVSVLVLDAGKPNLDDPLIMRPGQFGFSFGKPDYDWAFMTAPQALAGGRPFFWPRGKSLGGSSAMNFAVWSKPPKVDIDDWERLGNANWNWNNYQKFNEGLATFYPSEDGEINKYAPGLVAPWKETFGHGPLMLSQPKRVLPVQVKIQETFAKIGIPTAPAPNDGVPDGSYVATGTLDPATNERSYAPNVFMQPHSSRPNYKVLTGAYVRKIITSGDRELSATGVEFSVDGDVYEVVIRKEVILCAGALKSPQVLELSGIGRPEVLSSIDVPLKLALYGVGENVQEHIHVGPAFQLKDDVPDYTYEVLRDPESYAKHLELFTKNEGVFMISATTFAYLPLSTVSPRADKLLEAEKKKIDAEKATYPPGLEEQYKLMLDKIEKGAPGFELVMFPGHVSMPKQPEPGKKYVTLAAATNYNFSRGSIHSKSNDPMEPPTIDPHYFEHDIDLQVLLDMVKYIRTIAATAPFSEYLLSPDAELNPGSEAKTDQEILDWIKSSSGTTFHTGGSLSMLPKEMNGVVDSKLKVYGTTNIRVADMSIVPLHFSGHSVATAYTIGAFGAAIIKGEF